MKIIIQHIVFWIVLMLVFAISEWGRNHSLSDAITSELLFLPARLILVYSNWMFFIPKILYKRKNLQYAILFIVSAIILGVGQRVVQVYWAYPIFFPEWMEDGQIHFFKPTVFLQNALIIFFPAALTSGWKIYTDYKQKRD